MAMITQLNQLKTFLDKYVGDMEIVELLLQHGANVNEIDWYGNTAPIKEAAIQGNTVYQCNI